MSQGSIYRVEGVEFDGAGWLYNGLFIQQSEDPAGYVTGGGDADIVHADGVWSLLDNVFGVTIATATGPADADLATLNWILTTDAEQFGYDTTAMEVTKVDVAISEPQELQAIGSSLYTRAADYIQVNDIDMDVAGYNEGEGFDPIGKDGAPGRFVGSYNGQNYTIKNLFIDRPSTNNVALFGALQDGFHLRKIRVVNANITAGQITGSLAGNVGRGTIERCSATGDISGTLATGGLIGGLGNEAVVLHCYANVNVTGRDGGWHGGFVGGNRGKIYDCYARGNVNGTSHVGGFAGHNDKFGDVEGTPAIYRSYATGQVEGTENVGRFAGSRSDHAQEVDEHNYWVSDDAGSVSAMGSRLSTADAKDPDNYLTWNFRRLWDIDPAANDGFPFLNPRKTLSGYKGLYLSLYRKR